MLLSKHKNLQIHGTNFSRDSDELAESSLFRMCISRGLANEQYLSVLEDNPFAPWNEQVDQEVARAIDQYFKQEEQTWHYLKLKLMML